MDKEDIIRMAREAGLVRTGDKWVEPARWGVTELVHFAAFVAAHEREECALIAKDWDASHPHTNYGACISNAIRARGEK